MGDSEVARVKVTNSMLRSWIRAAFLVIIGMLLLLYIESIIREIESNFESVMEGSADSFFRFLKYILYILAFSLFFAAAINILAGFQESRANLGEIYVKLDDISEKLDKLTSKTTGASRRVISDASEEPESKVREVVPEPTPPVPEDLPPPPNKS